MAEFIRLKTSWINVDKIIRVENLGTESKPSCRVEYNGGAKLALDEDDSVSLVSFLQKTIPMFRAAS
jgi:hypothetical protein